MQVGKAHLARWVEGVNGMSGFTENRAHGASERPGQNERVLTWNASVAMLPLVGRIAQDIVRHTTRLAELRLEQAHLEEHRRTLAWPERARRYAVQEEIGQLEQELARNLTELEALGVTLLDPAPGLVGFPTIVNDRRAFFSWQPGETGLVFWNFAGDRVRREVPEHWTVSPQQPPRRRSRSESR
jgi:hypothetical protein